MRNGSDCALPYSVRGEMEVGGRWLPHRCAAPSLIRKMSDCLAFPPLPVCKGREEPSDEDPAKLWRGPDLVRAGQQCSTQQLESAAPGGGTFERVLCWGCTEGGCRRPQGFWEGRDGSHQARLLAVVSLSCGAVDVPFPKGLAGLRKHRKYSVRVVGLDEEGGLRSDRGNAGRASCLLLILLDRPRQAQQPRLARSKAQGKSGRAPERAMRRC